MKNIVAGTMSVVAAGLVSIVAVAQEFESDALTVPVTDLVTEDLVSGPNYTIDDTVTVSGYMHHYTVNSDFGTFTAVGDRALRKLIGEVIAIAQLKEMDSVSIGTDAAIGAVADTADSVVALATDPIGTVNNLSDGVSRFFKRTSKTAQDVSEKATETVTDAVSGDDDSGADTGSGDEPSVTTQLASSYLGIGKAQREIAQELKVDPYSYNKVLQAELSRVAQISGTVGKITNLLIPIPAVVGTAASVSDLVWNMSPTDLLILNQEKLTALGFDPDLNTRFFESKLYSPTEQTFLVSSIESMDQAENREVLIEAALSAETKIEGDFFLRAAEFYASYDQKVDRITSLLTGNRIPIAITADGDGLIYAALDHLLWTEEVATAVGEIEEIMDANSSSGDNLMWIEGTVSALTEKNLEELGWEQQPKGMEQLQ